MVALLRTPWLGLAAASVIALSVSGCGQRKDLFQAPPHGGASIPVPAPESSHVRLVLQVPFAEIQRAVEARLPASQDLHGSSRIGCAKVPYAEAPHVGSHQECRWGVCINVPDITVPSSTIGQRDECVDANWRAMISREGAVGVSRAADAVRIALPIRIDGQVGLSGDLARLLSLTAKNFEVHAVPQADTRFRMTPQWCPVLNLTPTHNWVKDAHVEVVGRNCVGIDLGPLGHPQACFNPANANVTGEVNRAVGDQEAKISAAASQALSCDSFRNAAIKAWHLYAFPLGEFGGEQAFLNIHPQEAAMSNLLVDDNGVSIAVEVAATTQVGTNAEPQTALDLPELKSADAGPGGAAKLNVRVLAPYQVLNNLLAKAVKGKDYSGQTPAGTVSIHVDDTDVYPSGDSIAIGVKIDAKVPGHWLDTKGWVYLTGRVVPQDGTKLAVEDLKYAQVVDNKGWDALAPVFENQVLAALRPHAVIDLQPDIDRAKNQLREASAKLTTDKVAVHIGAPDASLKDLAVGNDAFVAVVTMAAPIDIVLTAEALNP